MQTDGSLGPWEPLQLSNTVTKLRASDGAILGTVAVGDGPAGIAFDGGTIERIRVANSGSNTIMRLRPSDGAILQTFVVGASPFGVASDGSNARVANFGSDTVSKR